MPQIIPGLLVTEYSNILRLRQIKKPLSYCFLTSKKKKKNRKCFRQFVTGKKKNLFFDSIPNFGPWYHVFRNFNSGIAATLQHFRERWRFQERDFRECLYDDHVRTVGVRTARDHQQEKQTCQRPKRRQVPLRGQFRAKLFELRPHPEQRAFRWILP